MPRAAFVLISLLALNASAQFTAGDIKSLVTPDATWGSSYFTARCVSDTGECYVQSARFSTTMDVYADVAAYRAGSPPTRSVVFTGMASTGGQLIWVNGTIYGAVTVGGGPLGRWDPLTGAPIPTTLTAGLSNIAWGGGMKVLLGMDGNYIYVHKDGFLEVHDLNENLLAIHPVVGINTLTSGFAAGGYWYPVDYDGLAGPCMIFDRYEALTGAASSWPDTLANGCPYLVSAHFDPFFNRLLYTNGNAMTCQDMAFLHTDVLQVAPQVRTVDAIPLTVTAGLGGYAVAVDIENVGPNPLDVTLVELLFRDSMAVDVTAEYTVTPGPGNPLQIPAGATDTFDFSVDVDLAATVGTITLDASVQGIDSVTMVMHSDVGADTTDTWDVVACQAPICGDCNGDTMLTILDALVAAQHAAALLTLVGVDFSNCNVQGTLEPDPAAIVDILDALNLAQAAAGLPVMLICC